MGEFWTDPKHHTITKIAGDLRFTMDIRSESNEVLLAVNRHLREVAERVGRERQVSIDLGAYTNALPARMDATMQAVLTEEAARLGISALRMASGAGHDCAVFENLGVPCAMIFVRNDHGSHNAHEAMEIEDFALATKLLCALLDRTAL